MKIQKKNFFFLGGWGGGSGWGGHRLDVNKELKFLGKLKKKLGGGGVGGGGGGEEGEGLGG